MDALFSIIVFPGFLFLSVFGLAAEYYDRKLHARLQNRIGPPWYQPVADMIKLAAKEDTIPEDANVNIFKLAPIFALTGAVTASFYIPMWSQNALYSFDGDIIVVIYLLTIPTLSFFLGGWYSTSLYSKIGSVRTLTQLFAYEVPLMMSVLAPALLANTWCLSKMDQFYTTHPWYWLFNILGFLIALTALLGKLEKVPFDIPEAETEIVGGTFTEYGGRFLAIFRLTLDIEMIVASALLCAVYFPFGFGAGPLGGFVIFVIKIMAIVTMVAILRSVFARIRIDQMIDFCWRYLAPLAFLQVLFNLALKGYLCR